MNEYYRNEPSDILEDIARELKQKMKPKVGSKKIFFCKKCKEPTTHKLNIDGKTGIETWACFCCESQKYRTPKEIKKIKANRKGWARNDLS